MENICLIFARKNSKRLPGKNIMKLAGKPLIGWTIEQALSVSKIHRVIVSTDCENIAQIAKTFGAQVPFLRPKELASDKSPEWLSWQHALKMIINDTNCTPKMMISLPVTSPLRDVIDIENCINIFEKKNADIVISVTDAQRNPYFNMVQEGTDGSVSPVIRIDKKISRYQDAPKIFDMTTVAYVAKPEYVLKENEIFSGKTFYNHVPIERSIDIDTLFDFKIAEFLMLEKLGSKNG